MKRGISRTMLGSFLAVSLVSLSGCILDRVQTVKEQACHFDENFKVSHLDGLSVTFVNPVILYQDVTFLVGLPPRKARVGDKRFLASYTLKIIGGSENLEVPVDLGFELQEKELTLTDTSVRTTLPTTFLSAQLAQSSASACEFNLPGWRTGIEIPIPDFDRSLIPTRDEVISLVGSPTVQSADERELVYDFVLVGSESDEIPGSITLVYDKSGTILAKIHLQFHRYVVVTDFEQGKAWGELYL